MTNRIQYFKTFYDHPEYVAARDLLIPEAERIAYEVVGRKPTYNPDNPNHRPKTFEWANTWDQIFFREMNRLAKEAGLTD